MPTPSTLMADETLDLGVVDTEPRSRKEFGNVCAALPGREGAAVCSHLCKAPHLPLLCTKLQILTLYINTPVNKFM